MPNTVFLKVQLLIFLKDEYCNVLPNFATTCCSTPFTLLILIPVEIFGGLLVFISLAALIWSYSKSIIVIILKTLHTYFFYSFHPYVAFWKSLYPGSKEYSHSSSTQSENRQFSPDWMCGGELRHGDVRGGLQIKSQPMQKYDIALKLGLYLVGDQRIFCCLFSVIPCCKLRQVSEVKSNFRRGRNVHNTNHGASYSIQSIVFIFYLW